MNRASERRRAVRVQVRIPAVIEVLGSQPGRFDPDYESLAIPNEFAGRRFEGTILDLSVNGARVMSPIIPAVMSRLSLSFDVPGFGSTLAACLVMWRRTTPAISMPPVEGGSQGEATQGGFGVLFEAFDLMARLAIAQLAATAEAEAR